MIMQILAAITPHCPQATCSLNIPYMSSDYVGCLANLPVIGLRFYKSLILQANKIIFNLFAIFFRFFFAICNYHIIFAALLTIRTTKNNNITTKKHQKDYVRNSSSIRTKDWHSCHA